MKKIYMLLMITILIVAIGATAKYAGLLDVTDDGSVPEGTNINVPFYGTLTCQKSLEGPVNVPSSGLHMFNSETLKCASAFSLNDGCTVTMVMPSKDDVKGLYDANFAYTVCTNGIPCNPEIGQESIALRVSWVTTSHVDDVITETISDNQYILTSYNILEGAFSSWKLGDRDVGMSYRITPYKIYRDDGFSRYNGLPLDESLDCAINNNIDEANLLIEGINGDGDLSRDLDVSPYLDLNNLRGKGRTAVYLSNIVSVVPQYQFFDDGSKYCYDKRVYTVEQVITPGGVYSIAEPFSNKYENVECCNDMDAGPGFACDTNFKKIPVSEDESCNKIFDPCKYAGGIYTADNLYMYQECIDNKCVTQTVQVECGYDADCNGGVCIKDINNPKNNHCEALEPNKNCGNGICELTFMETAESCAKDCDPNYPDDNNMLLWIIVGAVALALIIFLSNGKNKGSGPINLG